MDLLQQLDISKSSGPDGISAKMLKGVASSIAPVLVKIFHLSIFKAKVPSRWKFSRVVAIPKGSSTNPSPSNFRSPSYLLRVNYWKSYSLKSNVIPQSVLPYCFQPMGILTWEVHHPCSVICSPPLDERNGGRK